MYPSPTHAGGVMTWTITRPVRSRLASCTALANAGRDADEKSVACITCAPIAPSSPAQRSNGRNQEQRGCQDRHEEKRIVARRGDGETEARGPHPGRGRPYLTPCLVTSRWNVFRSIPAAFAAAVILPPWRSSS